MITINVSVAICQLPSRQFASLLPEMSQNDITANPLPIICQGSRTRG